MISDIIKMQIIQVRNTGMTNMFDVRNVQYIASQLCLYDLVLFLEDRSNLSAYNNFILRGN